METMQGTDLITDILICILVGIPDCVFKLQDVWNVTYISCVVVYKNMSKLYVHDIALLSISLRVEIWKCICENSMIFLFDVLIGFALIIISIKMHFDSCNGLHTKLLKYAFFHSN